MAFEIDFLAVGDKSDSGDAIAMRFFNNAHQTVMVVDGGYEDSGEKLAELILGHYKSPADEFVTVDYVVSTHPDKDHIGGLDAILSHPRLHVRNLLLHQPWKHGGAVWRQINDHRATRHSVTENLRKSAQAAKALYDKASYLGIQVLREPFAGRYLLSDDRQFLLQILGPTEEYYNELLLQFPDIPEYARISKSAREVRSPAVQAENWFADKLLPAPKTSATNNSSVVLQVVFEGRRFLFTGDAGVLALEQAMGHLSTLASQQVRLCMVQAPHHGSRHNINSSVLDSMVGGINGGYPRSTVAVVSCAKEWDLKHPHKTVLNAFARRGVNCYYTNGSNFRWSAGAPKRIGYTKAEHCGFFFEVEND